MPRQPISNSARLVQCLLCGQDISDKSIKRHMAKHDGIEYPCRTCDKTFTQATNRDVHEKSSHKGLILVCDVCEWSTGQNAEMTRHKQDKHGHPTRGEKGGVRVSHSVRQVVGERVDKRRKRIAPYARAASSASLVRDVSPPAWSPSSDSLLAFSPSYPRLSLSPPPALASPDLLWNLDQPTVFESSQQTNELQMSSSPYDLDNPHVSLHDLSESFTENPFSDPEHLRKVMASGMPDAYASPLTPPSESTRTPPMTWSPTPSPDPLACSSGPSPAEAFFFDEYAFFLDQQRIPEQMYPVQELDSWKALASDDMEFLNELISHIAPDSLSVLPQDNQCLTF